jgi:hypothetical protein
MRALTGLATLLGLLMWTPVAAAQVFPDDADWTPLLCGDEPMADGVLDEPDAIDERDLVGDEDAPAGLRAADDDFFYLRLRLEADPQDGAVLRPFSWGMAFDLDLDRTTYEVLVLADGEAGQVVLFDNTEVTIDDDPTDPADLPPVAVYEYADAGGSVEADSDFGGDEDFFLDLAVPWADLEPLGLAPDSEIHVWAASSESADRLDGDFACHDGASGAPGGDDTASDLTVADPDVDSDGDGFPDAEEIEEGSDPDDPDDVPGGGGDDGGDDGDDERRLEGGAGCAAAGGETGAWLAAVLLLLLARVLNASRVSPAHRVGRARRVVARRRRGV